MNRVIPILGGVSALSVLSSCIVGNVFYEDGTPAVGVEVTFKACDTCPEYSALTDVQGYFSYDPYSNPELPAFMDPDDGVIVTVKGREWSEVEGPSIRCFRTGEIQLSHRTIYSTYVQPDGTEVQYTTVPDIYVERFSMLTDPAVPCETLDLTLSLQQIFADPDNDGLTVSIEALYNADFQDADTDRDGLSDGLEVYGMVPGGTPTARTWRAGSDIRSRGATPNRKDVFIEVDYWENESWTMRPGTDLTNMVVAHYAGLSSILNPDSSTGIDVVLVLDQELPNLTGCGDIPLDVRRTYRSARREEIFTFGYFCGSGGFGGAAPILGSAFRIRGRTDFNPSNDMTEYRQNLVYGSILHEFGHSLGLHHGGFQSRNCKPNYPSEMNYAYFPVFSLDGDFGSLATTKARYSNGELGPLNEETVSEYDPLDAPFGTVEFLNGFGKTTERAFPTFRSANDRTDVDWNRNGEPDSNSPPVPLRNVVGMDACSDTTFRVIEDSDDAATIEQLLDDPERLATPDPSLKSEADYWVPGGVESTVHGDDEETSVVPRPWIRSTVESRLRKLTGLEANRIRDWAEQAGFDPSDRAQMRLMERLADATTRGHAAKRILEALGHWPASRWLSQLEAEREASRGAEHLLRDRVGRHIEVSFVDCPFSPHDAAQLSAGRVPRARIAGIFDGEVDHIRLCR